MSQTQPDREITVLEYSRLEDLLEARLRDGVAVIEVQAIADEADVSVPKVREAMVHLSKKHDYITDVGAGKWNISPEE